MESLACGWECPLIIISKQFTYAVCNHALYMITRRLVTRDNTYSRCKAEALM